MRKSLIVLFALILVGMLAVTIRASLQEGLFAAGGRLWPSWWFRATLADAYFGFLTFYAWVFYKESSWASRIVWLLLVLLLGNIAMSIYMLIALQKMKSGRPAELLLRAEQDHTGCSAGGSDAI